MNVVQCEAVGTLREGEMFEWNIPGYVLKHKYSTKRSELFSYSRFPEFKFCLTLRPYADEPGNSVSFNLQLHRIPEFSSGSDSSSKQRAVPEIDVRFILYKSNSVHKWSCSMRMQENRLTADFPEVSSYDSLTIQCLMVSISSPPKTEECPSSEVSAPSQSSSNASEVSHSLVDDMATLLDSGILSDATLCVKDQVFNIHSCIVASRSIVFAAMFKHDTKEKRENRIVIIDFHSETISQVLKYIYTDQVDGNVTFDQLLSLFSAADKYALLDLRKKCSLKLRQNLAVDSVIDVLVAADLHQDEDLKKTALQMFLKNAVTIMESDQWLPFMKSQVDLANYILMHLAKKSSGILHTCI